MLVWGKSGGASLAHGNIHVNNQRTKSRFSSIFFSPFFLYTDVLDEEGGFGAGITGKAIGYPGLTEGDDLKGGNKGGGGNDEGLGIVVSAYSMSDAVIVYTIARRREQGTRDRTTTATEWI